MEKNFDWAKKRYFPIVGAFFAGGFMADFFINSHYPDWIVLYPIGLFVLSVAILESLRGNFEA